MRIGLIIQNYRMKHSMSMDAFAKKCGLSKGYIGMLEQGVHPKTKKPLHPSVDTIKRVAAGMGTDFDTLFKSLDEDFTLNDTTIAEKTDTEDVQKKGIIRYIKTLIAAEKENKANRKQLEEILKMAEELYGVDEETGEMVMLFHNATPEMQKAALAVLKAGQQPTEQTE